MHTESVQFNNKQRTPSNFGTTKPCFPTPDPFHHYLQAYVIAFHLHQRMAQLQSHKNRLTQKVQQLEENLSKIGQEQLDKPKRTRRLAQNITKMYQCEHERCERTYGTLGSLQQHKRLKHQQLAQTVTINVSSSM